MTFITRLKINIFSCCAYPGPTLRSLSHAAPPTVPRRVAWWPLMRLEAVALCAVRASRKSSTAETETGLRG